MPEPISITTTATIVTTGVKVSAVTALITMVSTDVDMAMVLIVGIIGGIVYIVKEFVLEEFLKAPLRSLFNMPFSILMAMSLTGIVFYAGIDGINPHVKDLGIYVWIFLAFMAGMNYNRVTNFFVTTFAGSITAISKRVSNKND